MPYNWMFSRSSSLQRVVRAKKTSVPSLETYAYRNNDWENLTPTQIPAMRRKMSDPDIHHGTSAMLAALVRDKALYP